MGTNYYAYDVKSKEQLYHIGKRSAAGHFCWDCGMSSKNIAKDNWDKKPYIYGTRAIHCGGFEENRLNNEPTDLEYCPVCGKPFHVDKEEVNAMFAELGFSKQPNRTNNTTCSFMFGISPYVLSDVMSNENICVIDEYGRELTKEEFKEVIQNCGVKYYDFVGEDFS
jgi:hypothetical protein